MAAENKRLWTDCDGCLRGSECDIRLLDVGSKPSSQALPMVTLKRVLIVSIALGAFNGIMSANAWAKYKEIKQHNELVVVLNKQAFPCVR